MIKYKQLYVRDRESERGQNLRRDRRQRKETEQLFQSSFIPPLTMWLKPMRHSNGPISRLQLHPCSKGVSISRPPMYTHLGLQVLITISTSVPSGTPNGLFGTDDMFETGNKSPCLFSTLQHQGTNCFLRSVHCKVIWGTHCKTIGLMGFTNNKLVFTVQDLC